MALQLQLSYTMLGQYKNTPPPKKRHVYIKREENEEKHHITKLSKSFQ